jgi:hypothetical protein
MNKNYNLGSFTPETLGDYIKVSERRLALFLKNQDLNSLYELQDSHSRFVEGAFELSQKAFVDSFFLFVGKVTSNKTPEQHLEIYNQLKAEGKLDKIANEFEKVILDENFKYYNSDNGKIIKNELKSYLKSSLDYFRDINSKDNFEKLLFSWAKPSIKEIGLTVENGVISTYFKFDIKAEKLLLGLSKGATSELKIPELDNLSASKELNDLYTELSFRLALKDNNKNLNEGFTKYISDKIFSSLLQQIINKKEEELNKDEEGREKWRSSKKIEVEKPTPKKQAAPSHKFQPFEKVSESDFPIFALAYNKNFSKLENKMLFNQIQSQVAKSALINDVISFDIKAIDKNTSWNKALFSGFFSDQTMKKLGLGEEKIIIIKPEIVKKTKDALFVINYIEDNKHFIEKAVSENNLQNWLNTNTCSGHKRFLEALENKTALAGGEEITWKDDFLKFDLQRLDHNSKLVVELNNKPLIAAAAVGEGKLLIDLNRLLVKEINSESQVTTNRVSEIIASKANNILGNVLYSHIGNKIG